jgi:hypothetical protein
MTHDQYKTKYETKSDNLWQLPLSFMSSIFAIQIDAFPHNEETGEVSWPLGRVMSLLCMSYPEAPRIANQY